MPTKATKPPVKKITSWSFSRYNDYKTCPRLAKLKHLDKLKEPGSNALLRGSLIHTMAEEYIKGKLPPKMPPELAAFADAFKKLRKLYKTRTAGIVVEDDWAFTNSWSRTRWDDWVGCWVRIKLDNADNENPDILVIRDWKTGKFRPEKNEEYVEQLELYALAGLLLYPHVKEVHPELIYLDVGTVYPATDKDIQQLTFTQADVPRLKKLWEKRTKPMFNDTTFAPRPGNGCRWCFFGQSGKAKGGPGLCEF